MYVIRRTIGTLTILDNALEQAASCRWSRLYPGVEDPPRLSVNDSNGSPVDERLIVLYFHCSMQTSDCSPTSNSRPPSCTLRLHYGAAQAVTC